jgi:hypothetical protein
LKEAQLLSSNYFKILQQLNCRPNFKVSSTNLLDPAAQQNGQREFLQIYVTADSQKEAEQR